MIDVKLLGNINGKFIQILEDYNLVYANARNSAIFNETYRNKRKASAVGMFSKQIRGFFSKGNLCQNVFTNARIIANLLYLQYFDLCLANNNS